LAIREKMTLRVVNLTIAVKTWEKTLTIETRFITSDVAICLSFSFECLATSWHVDELLGLASNEGVILILNDREPFRSIK
jgi:hypothetical protein